MVLISNADRGNSYILAAQVAESATFQAVTGAANQAAALDLIHYPYVDFDETGAVLADLRPPRCIISDELGDEEWTVSGGMREMSLRETWWMSFDFAVPATHTSEGGVANEWAWFQLQVRNILKEIRDLGATGEPVTGKAYMRIQGFRRVEGPYRLGLDEKDLEASLDHPDIGVPQPVWHVAYVVERGY